VLPPIPLEEPNPRWRSLAEASEHDGDHEGGHTGVEQQVSNGKDGADGRWDPDHVGQRRQRVLRTQEVMLAGASSRQPCGICPGRLDGARAHGHAAVRPDDHEVEDEPRHHEPQGWQPPVRPGDPEEEPVGTDHHRGAGGADDLVRQRDPLEREPDERRPPPPHMEVFEGSEAATRDEPDHDGHAYHDEHQHHVGKSPIPKGIAAASFHGPRRESSAGARLPWTGGG
jgi:hypothetical protein